MVTTATAAWVTELQDALGAGSVLLDPDVTAAYARDQAMLAPAGTPAAVVLPRSTADVVAVMQVATRHGVPVVPRGAGSGLAGASNAVDGAITLVMTRMDAVLEVAPADRLAVVQPGVVNKSLRDAVAGAGPVLSAGPLQLRLVHDRREPLHELRRPVLRQVRRHHRLRAGPGGRARRRAGAAHGAAHGQGRRRLRPGPAVRRARRAPSASSPRRRSPCGPAPQRPVTLAATFATTAQTGQVVERVVTSGLVPSLLEVMDNTCICAVDDLLQADLDRGAHALLVAQSDCRGRGRRGRDRRPRRAVRGGRRGLRAHDRRPGGGRPAAARPPDGAAGAGAAGLARSSTTSRCPGRASRTFLDGCDAIAAERGLVIGVVGHAGDGNMHPTICFDPTDDDQRDPGLRRLRRHPRARAVPRRDDHRRARGGRHQGRLAGARDRPGGPRRAPRDQGRARPGRPAQPRQGVPAGGRADLAAVAGLAAEG